MDKIISIPIINNTEKVKKFACKNALIKSLIAFGVILFLYLVIILCCYLMIEDWNFISDSNFILAIIITIVWCGFIFIQTYKRSGLIAKYIKRIELRAKRFIIVANASIEYEYHSIKCMKIRKDYFIIKTNNADHLIPNCLLADDNIKKIEEKLKANNVLIK